MDHSNAPAVIVLVILAVVVIIALAVRKKGDRNPASGGGNVGRPNNQNRD